MREVLLWLAVASVVLFSGDARPSDTAIEEHAAHHKKFLESIINSDTLEEENPSIPEFLPKFSVKPEGFFDEFAKQMKMSQCPPGFTGSDCENPICDSWVHLDFHNGMDTANFGETIETDFSRTCNNAFAFPVDEYLTRVYVSIGSMSDISPTGVLYTSDGVEIAPTETLRATELLYIAVYDNLAAYGYGIFAFVMRSGQPDVCSYTVTAPTRAVIDGGFITEPTDDNVQRFIPEPHEGITRHPVLNVSSHFAFGISPEFHYPAMPTAVAFYRNGAYEHDVPVKQRYKCKAASVAGPYNCTMLNTFHHLKVTGIDTNGNRWQRVYSYSCLPGGTVPPITPPPIPDECYNGGKLINGGTENATCFCGYHYEGYMCQYKRCFNDGFIGKYDSCVCQMGYGGTYCEEVICPGAAPTTDFDVSSRALTFIVRSGVSMAGHMRRIIDAAVNITSYYELHHARYFQAFVLVVVANGNITLQREFDDSASFIASLQGIVNYHDLHCDDSLLLALSTALDSPAIAKFRHSPIFLFSDGLSNDDEQTRVTLLNQLTHWRGQVFFMLTDSLNGRCTIDMASQGYRQMRMLAQFSHGLVSHVSLEDMGMTAFNLATTLYQMNYLMSNDLLDSCNRAPKYQTFAVDDDIGDIYIIGTGFGLQLTLTGPDRKTFSPKLYYSSSDNTYIWFLPWNEIEKGTYLLTMTSTGKHPCQYRVMGRGTYDLFLGVSTELTEDQQMQQPIYREQSHIVAHLNNIFFGNTQAINAEATIWSNEGESDTRTVLYASNGFYRSNCGYHLYFGAWICRQPEQLFYVNVFVTDTRGFTVQRTTTGFCSTIPPTSKPPDGCLNGGVSVNGTCLCQAHWKGDKCQTIQCLNLGTPLATFCACVEGFTGQYCETTSCFYRNENTQNEWSPNGRSLSFLIHDSIATRSTIRTVRERTARLVQDLVHHHPSWITNFQVLRFNEQNYSRIVDSPRADAFLRGINEVYDYNIRHSEVSCANLTVLSAVLDSINDPGVSYRGMLYVFINGYADVDVRSLAKIYERLEATRIEVSVVMLTGSPCGESLGEYESSLLMNLVAFSGGQFYMVMPSNAGKVVNSIPTLYRSSYVYENFVSDCTAPQTFYFPVDSQMQSFTSYVVGDLDVDPVYYGPDGLRQYESNLWTDIGMGSRMDQIIKPCDNGWTRHDQRCLIVSLELVSWNEAARACHAVGATLPSILNAEEQAFMDEQAGETNYWIGLNQIQNHGRWEWDQIGNDTLSLANTGYTNWAVNQPDMSKEAMLKQCVYDHHKGENKGWTNTLCEYQFVYICMKHAYDTSYEPESQEIDILPRGIWKAVVKSYEGPCYIQIFAQSGIQLYTQYTSNIHYDVGKPQPLTSSNANRILGHTTNQQMVGQGVEGQLQYAHMYNMNLTIIQAQNFQRRSEEECAFEYISTPFRCPHYTFQTLTTGIDRYGYLYQRIQPVTCLSGAHEGDCVNGGVFYNGECACPPHYRGDYCEEPICENGYLASSLVTCICNYGYVGKFCTTPYCTTHGSLPNLSPNNRTFVLLLDGSQTQGMEDVIAKFDDVMNGVNTETSKHPEWFTHYTGLVFRDKDADASVGRLSDVIEEDTFEAFKTRMTTEAQKPYKAVNRPRSVIAAVIKILESDMISPRSPVFIVTSGNTEDHTRESLALSEVARKHAYINILIVGDTEAPGGVNYTDDSLGSYYRLSFVSGGGFYQTGGTASNLITFWSALFDTLFNTYHVTTVQRTDCSGLTEHIQIGANSSLIIMDVFAEVRPVVNLLDADGNPVRPTNFATSMTNTMTVAVADGEPGLWSVKVDPVEAVQNPGFCSVSVRGLSTMDIYIAFNHDIGTDRGYHSDTADLYPIVGEDANAIVAETNGGILTFAQVFTADERVLLWAAPLIRRDRCSYHYISQRPFTCRDPSIAVAIDGEDFEGHPFRRMIHVHCVGNFKPETTTPIPPSTTSMSTTTGVPLPTCDPAEPKFDVIIVMDGSLGIPDAEFVDVVNTLQTIPFYVTIGPDNTRIILGVYYDHVEYIFGIEDDGNDFDSIPNAEEYAKAVDKLATYGHTQEMGNNIYGILESVNVSTFRDDKDVQRLIIFFSSMGWDESNTGMGYPDPTDLARGLTRGGINIIPIGYGTRAKKDQLQIVGRCVQMAKNQQELDAILPWLMSRFCMKEQFC